VKVCRHCGAARDLWPLNLKQAEVMKLLAQGHRYTEICAKLNLAPNTVFMRVHRAVEALGCATVIQAIAKLAERGYFKDG
jgi:DNA-binding CsgD family transcriptional regulator